MRRWAILVVGAALAALVAVAPGPAVADDPVPVVVDAPIGAGSDDAEQFAAGNSLLTSPDLELVDADEGAGQVVGLRFTGLGIPAGATVTEAWVQFTVDETQTDSASLTIAAQAATDAPTFSAVGANNVSARPRTSATAAWSPDPWTVVGSDGPASRTPDLSAVVQEVVDGLGWTTASPLALVITGTGHRTAAAEEATTLAPPRLHVAYLAPEPYTSSDTRVSQSADDAEEAPTTFVTRSSADLELVDDAGVLQTVGVRFADLGIPRGAVIRRAWIQFTADETQADPTALTIAAHDVDNAPKLGPNNRNVSSRNPTAATVAWAPPAWTTVGQAGAPQRTPDLRALVQEVVDRPYWAGETGALAFTFQGTGHRTAVAYDGSPAQAPALHVDWSAGTPAPHAPEVRRFGVIGDYGNGNTGEGNVANLINGLGVDDVLTVGDNSYGAAPIDENIGRHYLPYIGNYHGLYGTGAPVNRFWPALGNHEISDGGGLPAYLDYFTLPGNERYYDVVLGDVQFFFVDSNPSQPHGITAASTQGQWLRNAVAASTAPWQIVLLHHSPYSSGLEHGSNPTLQWPFASWGVDAVLSGHDHDYERLEADGIPYIVTGAGGVSRYPQGTVDPHSVFFDSSDDGALLLEACAGRLAFTYHTVSSGVLDNRTVGGPTCGVPTVTVVATDPDAAEVGMDPGTFTFSRSTPTNAALTVAYTVGGTAAAPADYLAMPGTVTIPAGQTSATVTVTPVNDIGIEPDETVVLSVTDRAGYDPGNPTAAAVTLRSDDSASTVNQDLYPTSMERVFGTTTAGGLLSLRTSDNQRLAIREELGPQANPNSQLEYRFTLPALPVHQQVMLVVEGHHSPNTEGDDLVVEWARGGPWRELVKVTKTADNGTAQFKLLPGWVNAGDVITLRVRDANRVPGKSQLDTAFLDRLFLRAVVPA